MLGEIKEELLKNPDAIVGLLEAFDFAHIKASAKEIRFARDYSGGKNISIRLENNDNVYVNDFARGVSRDIFSYIIQEKGTTFREVLQRTKKILNLSDDWQPQRKRCLFGGIYNHIGRRRGEIKLKTYSDDVLNKYERIGNLRFLRDGINLDSQKFWDIRFSVEDNAIIIPLYNEYGDCIGAKARVNGDPEEGQNKYYYPIPTQVSQTLYGYAANYEYLFEADTIYIGESEKYCEQLYTMGIRNCVSLGSHTLSEKQAKLLLQLSPKSVTFMLDDSLDLMETKKNADMIKSVAGMRDIDVYFFDHTDCILLGEKDSPSDHGIEVWSEIVENHIKNIDELQTIQN